MSDADWWWIGHGLAAVFLVAAVLAIVVAIQNDKNLRDSKGREP
ncbi:MAG: hypothetical protein AB7J28_01845 [Hyphomonadaceae bacterium]